MIEFKKSKTATFSLHLSFSPSFLLSFSQSAPSGSRSCSDTFPLLRDPTIPPYVSFLSSLSLMSIMMHGNDVTGKQSKWWPSPGNTHWVLHWFYNIHWYWFTQYEWATLYKMQYNTIHYKTTLLPPLSLFSFIQSCPVTFFHCFLYCPSNLGKP